MKNRTFYATFFLFLFAIYTGIFAMSAISLQDTLQQVKYQCLNEQYLISSTLYNDIATLENRGIQIDTQIESLIQPYLYLAGNRKSAFSVYQDNQLLYTIGEPFYLQTASKQNIDESRNVFFHQNQNQYFCGVAGALPKPFHQYFIFYQIDMTDHIEMWKYRNNMMLVTGGAISLILAFFLLLLLNKLFHPLFQITQLSQKIADGNYAVRLPDKGKDEISQMAHSFNHMANEIENKITELAISAENKQQFVDNFAHELRTPLTAIYGYAEYMQKAALNKEDSHFALECILSESRRIQMMANQLMELSNLRNGEIQMKSQSLCEILDSVKHTVSQKLIEKNMQLEIVSNIKTITADAILLQNLFVNLIDNAIKASSIETTITIEAFYQSEKPVIKISDQGNGMSQEELTRITQPYYRVDKSRNYKDGGAGLGLAICQQIVNRHEAKLFFESTIGYGTTVTIIFTTP